MTNETTPAAPPRQYIKFTFFKVRPEWRLLPEGERRESRETFADVLEQSAETVFTRTYSTVGMRGDCDFLVWQAAMSLEAIQEVTTRLLSTKLGAYLDTAHSYLAMTKRSIYIDNHSHEEQDGRRTRIRPADRRYFFVYPFVKTRNWYQLPFEQRQEIMDAHIKLGTKYSRVKLNTTYSFGIDDQEFVVAFETDHPEDFLDLVMELRETKSSLFTLRDTPIFTCIAGDATSVLDTLGGQRDAGPVTLPPDSG